MAIGLSHSDDGTVDCRIKDNLLKKSNSTDDESRRRSRRKRQTNELV
jgi:hypothetical protein